MAAQRGAVLGVMLAGACGSSSGPAPAHAPSSAAAPPSAPASASAPTALSAPAPAPTTSTPCDRVVAGFDRLSASMMGQQPDANLRAKMQYQISAMKPILADECTTQPFSAALIDCFASATSGAAWSDCEAEIPQVAREAMQERLDAIPPPPPSTDAERVELARSQVRRIAFEYFPLWAVRPQNRGCPPSLAALEPYARPEDSTWKDPWGNAFTFSCSGTQLNAVSAGPDRKPGTGDDISSKD